MLLLLLVTKGSSIYVEVVSDSSDTENYFGGEDCSVLYQQFEEQLCTTDNNDVGSVSLKTMQLLILGKLEKGTLSQSSKVK